MIDIHSHILHRVDDGASSIEMAVEMLREASKAGVTKIIATPHARHHIDFGRVYKAMSELSLYAPQYGIELGLGFELYYSILLKLTAEELPKYCFQGTSTLLLEFQTQILPPEWEYTLSDLAQAGYKLIIAHPERYRFVQNKPEMVCEMKRYGCKIQLDAMSYATAPWDPCKKAFKHIYQNGWADYVCSDAHRPAQYTQYGEIMRKLKKLKVK